MSQIAVILILPFLKMQLHYDSLPHSLMCVGGNCSYQIRDKNKAQAKERGQGEVSSGATVSKQLPHTELSEIFFDATPGVFGDERLDYAPRLLLVFYVGVNPGSITDMVDGSHLKDLKVQLISLTLNLTLADISSLSCV